MYIRGALKMGQPENGTTPTSLGLVCSAFFILLVCSRLSLEVT